MTKPWLATSIADPEGHLLDKLRGLWPLIPARFQGVAVQATSTTDPRVLELLSSADAKVGLADPDINAIGRHRRQSLDLALKHGDAHHIVYLDTDHLLRWLENDVRELDQIVPRIGDWDCTVIGRGCRSLATVPRRLAETESIVNHVYTLITGQKWDLMMAARGLSRKAAESIVDECLVDTIGNDVAWPLFCKARGFSVGYIEADGLTYLTNADYAQDREDSLDRDPEAWALRVRLAAQHVEAMMPYMTSAPGDST